VTTIGDRRSWVPTPTGSPFPIQNLPYGVFSDASGTRCGVAIGDSVFDLARAESAGLFANTGLEHDTFRRDSLNEFLAHNRGVWTTVRTRITEVLDADNADGQSFADAHDLIVSHPVILHVPVDVGDFVDFYSSEQHALNVGRIFRPDGEALLPNWKHLPVGYHGRAGTIVVSGTTIHRPNGQRRGANGPVFGPTEKLDLECEVGFVTGHGPGPGTAIRVEEAEHHIFGLCLVNDWSARDIQAWEYVPLGPFLGKSFATTISPWIVPLEALEPYRTPAPTQAPEPLPYLRSTNRVAVDLDLSVSVTSSNGASATVCRTSFATMYWTMAQQLAHATVNGATVRPGDLFASGTVSGQGKGAFGSLLEVTWNGEEPFTLSDGSTRTFLEDGDTVSIVGSCSAPDVVTIGFGPCTGTVVRGSTHR
jgi:fumarylacetoacetase